MATRPLAPAEECASAPNVGAPAVRMVIRRWVDMAQADQVGRWDALARWAAEPNPFHESWYLLPALRASDPTGKVRLLCLEADGVLTGLLPVSRDLLYYGYPLPQLFGWTHPNCFLGAPLVATGFETAFWGALLDWADRTARMELFLHLAQIPLSGPLHLALARLCAEQGRELAVVQRVERAMLASDLSSDAYLDFALGGKKRKELRRQRRRLSDEGDLQVRRAEGEAELDEWIDSFLALEKGGWKGDEGSALASSPATEGLFREALRGAARRDRLERLDLTLDGAPVAMLATFLISPGAFSFKTAFDERFARFSPGVLLQCENLALLERTGIEWADSCAAADHPMIDHLWRERRPIGRVSVAIGGPLRRKVFGALARREMRGETR